jgi:glycosyltransferase involved in cell wall biosynthesis
MSKPKVLYMAQNHPEVRPGGAEGYALDLYHAMKRIGEFEPVFCARTGPPISNVRRYVSGAPFTAVNDDPNQYFFWTDLTHYDWFFGRPSDKSILSRFFRDFLLAQRPDVIHFQHTLFIGYEAVRIARRTLPDAPIVYMLHEYLPICHRDGQMVRTVGEELCQEETPQRCHECFPGTSPQLFFARKRFIQSQLGNVDVFIAPSEYVRDRYADWGVPRDKIKVAPYACWPVERPAETQERPRNRFAFFGQFTPYKGADVLLEAMASLGEDFNGHLWIYGANLETQRPEFREKFESMLKATGSTVTFAGHYDHAELPKLMERIDWVICPSIWWETGPIVVLEAFQYGRPVICSDIGGMSEKVTDGVSGLHFRRGDPASLADAIDRAANTPGIWDRMRAGIPQVPRIMEHAAEMTELYNDLLQGRRPGPAARLEAAGAVQDG